MEEKLDWIIALFKFKFSQHYMIYINSFQFIFNLANVLQHAVFIKLKDEADLNVFLSNEKKKAGDIDDKNVKVDNDQFIKYVSSYLATSNQIDFCFPLFF